MYSMQRYLAALALLAVACGGGEKTGQTQTTQTTPSQPESAAAAPAVAPSGTGTVHQIQMLMTSDGKYQFQPADVTIKVGDTVRWLNVSGFPHNISFYENQIPTGGKAFLDGVYATDQMKIGPLAGRLLTQANETYEIAFTGAPTGTYHYYCTPHEALGMKGTITVTP
jgi:plastocyanin